MEPCKNEGVGEDGYCIEHGCCLCGGDMLADTEDWPVLLCGKHYLNIVEDSESGYLQHDVAEQLKGIVHAAYEAGRKSVLGKNIEPDHIVEQGVR
jgi:hypothetical protein